MTEWGNVQDEVIPSKHNFEFDCVSEHFENM